MITNIYNWILDLPYYTKKYWRITKGIPINIWNWVMDLKDVFYGWDSHIDYMISGFIVMVHKFMDFCFIAFDKLKVLLDEVQKLLNELLKGIRGGFG